MALQPHGDSQQPQDHRPAARKEEGPFSSEESNLGKKANRDKQSQALAGLQEAARELSTPASLTQLAVQSCSV